jgi:hypothetical protein
MVANFLWKPGTSNDGLTTAAATLMTTELNSLVNNAYAVTSAGFTNNDTAQAIWAQLFLTLGAIGTAVQNGGNIAGWFLRSYDGGTTYEQTAAQPGRSPDFYFPLPATTIAAASVWGSNGLVLLPAVKYKVGVLNTTGQTLASSGNTVRAAPVNMQTP